MRKHAYSPRGSYRQSQENQSYLSRAMDQERVARLVDESGHLTFGKWKGVHVSKVPSSYIAWASENIRGFASLLRQNVPVARPRGGGGSNVPESASKADVGPSEAQERAWRECDDSPIPQFDPDDALDWEDDPGMGAYFEQG